MTTNTTTYDYWMHNPCGGDHPSCKKAQRQGRPVHIIPVHVPGTSPALVMPDYHFATEEEAIAALRDAEANAPTVKTDNDLYRYRAQRIAHKLPVGWVDPTRR